MACSLQTVGYGWVGICDVSCENGRFLRKAEKLVRMGNVQFAEKAYFAVYGFMKDNKNNERRFSSCYGNNFAQAQTNERQRIQPKKTYCELAVQHPFFESQQSCVSTKVTLSHRFKSSPAIPGKLAVPGAAGYMMNAGHFRKSYVSSGDLNRPWESRGSQPSISLKHGRLAHVRSQFSLFRRSPTHKNLPPATFCTSERVFAVLFARRKK